MAVVPIPLIGASYKHRGQQLVSQVTQNMYPEYNEEAKEIISLQPTPGAVSFSAASNTDRGLGVYEGELYQVLGGNLQKVSGSGVRTTLAAIPGSGRCLMRSDGGVLVIVSGDGAAYSWDGATLSVGSSNFESPTSMAYMNNQFIYPGLGQKFWVADVGAPLTVNAANYGFAYSSPDDLVRPYDFNQRIYMMGTQTIEPYWNSGTGNPPIDRIEQGLITVGLGAKYSVSHNDNFLYFVGDDKTAYRLVGSNAQRISDVSFANALEGYTTSDAIGFCYTIQNQNFYQVSFPTDGKTWCYHETTGKWFEMTTASGRHLANDYAYIYGKHLVSDYRTGSIMELSLDAFDDAGEAIIRVRDSGLIDSSYMGAQFAGRELEMNWLRLVMPSGVGLSTGQGSDPVVMLRFSDDRGKTWSSEMQGRMGESGDFQREIVFDQLGSFYNRMIRVSCSDPVFFGLYAAQADVEPCIA